MAYVQLDDQIAQHPKILRAGGEAAWLWACAIAYCNRQLTDGHIPAAALGTLGTFKTPARKLAATLVAVGLFDQDGPDYRVHDYLRHNPDRSTVHARMRDAADRKAAYRARKSHRDEAVPRRDGDADVPVGHHEDTGGTDASSRATRTDSTPTPTPTDTPRARASASAAVVPIDSKWGASPSAKGSASVAWRSTLGVDIPHKLHTETVQKFANAGRAEPEAAALAWYRRVEDAWRGKSFGDDAFVFWRARLVEELGSSTGRASSGPPLPTFDEAVAEQRRFDAELAASRAQAARDAEARGGPVRLRDLVGATGARH